MSAATIVNQQQPIRPQPARQPRPKLGLRFGGEQARPAGEAGEK
ncbi:hypothetical protein SAMN05192583_2523 [Sphingomonas gellani]|uniref:Uncharacterized protein n=1 Tax=Sphingomonas gellani TaxID=1166340 RepID=A0A1H8FPV3_9SPHN|nr:hypothetical protein [Sphingomonas gellani]SEN33723.1 hypothetical protein SAMN05192583_2523 [Sphingomonas gellani]